MKIDILTLFPEMFESVLSASMVGRAVKKGLLEISLHDIRAYSADKHSKTDDYPFGGGKGMLMTAQPIFDAIEALPEEEGEKPVYIYLSPRGRLMDKERLSELSREKRLVLLCGHYEGVDERVLEHFAFEELSIGDYVLTGGELPAMVLTDALARFIPGVLGKEECATEESVYSGLLEYPQYTQPRSFRGLDVPEVLVSGDHRKIYLWNFEQALKLTKKRRPELFSEYVKNASGELAKDERKVLEKVLDME